MSNKLPVTGTEVCQGCFVFSNSFLHEVLENIMKSLHNILTGVNAVQNTVFLPFFYD